ncbi:MAG: thermonuclease family protein [Desulfobacterota bacterium]|nr:thermonuclease family protein [Thermodesulfobacteriota bacterium]
MKVKLAVSQNTIQGVGILCGIALVAAVACSNPDNMFSNNVRAVPSHAVKVIDGDTIEIDGERIRLYGIDAPERGQPCTKNDAHCDCGELSKSYLEFLIAGTTVTCRKKGKDAWNRWVGQCTADGEDLGQMMVRHGWAIAYRQYAEAYVHDEVFARKNKLGIWSKEFSMPSEWRKTRKGGKS